MKRLVDVVVASAAIVMLSPLLLAISILVRLKSPGSVIFRQIRVGRGGVPFQIFKFRTMVEPTMGGHKSPLITQLNDPRITKVGGILRSTKLDELPQLVNVVRGDMSLVGPRPEVSQYVELWDPNEREIILSVRPGITDPASVEFRRESELLALQKDPEMYYRSEILPLKSKLYVEYVTSQNFRGDLQIMLTTLQSILGRR